MRLPEQQLYDWLYRRLGGRGLIHRVENSIQASTPDLFIAIGGLVGWIELKAIDAFPVRATTCVNLRYWTNAQRLFQVRLASNGGNGWLVLRVGREVFVVNGAFAVRDSDEWTQAHWRLNAECIPWDGMWPVLLDGLKKSVLHLKT